MCRKTCLDCGASIAIQEYEQHCATHIINLATDISSSSCSEDLETDLTETELQYIQEMSECTKDYVVQGNILSRYNFELSHFSSSKLKYLFKRVYKEQKNAFKVNASLGFLLRHKESGELAFYGSSQNNQRLFESTYIVRNGGDKLSIMGLLDNMALCEKIELPNTKWVCVCVTNITFYVYRLKGLPIGSPVELPDYLKNAAGLITLTSSSRGKKYNDKKCFFRCLALFKGCKLSNVDSHANRLLKSYCKMAAVDMKDFDGVSIDKLEDVSRLFDIPIKVYHQDNDGNTELVFRTIKDESSNQDALRLLVHQEHFCYIKNMDLFAKCHYCPKCKKGWKHAGHFNRHVKTCEVGIKEKYTDGVFQLKKTVFNKLEEVGINVPKKDRIFPYRSTLDIECLLEKSDQTQDTEKTSYLHQHSFVSVSVCSNVPGYREPRNFCLETAGGQKEVVERMLAFLNEISIKSAELLRQKFSAVIEQIESDSEELVESFNRWLEQLPVITFNGSKYDLNVLRKFLIPLIVKQETYQHVIKKGSAYLSISTNELKFLDITAYISPGFSYDKFLKAYNAPQQKSYFPYEYLDSFEKLELTEFPRYEDFYSSLKGMNTLEPLTKDDLEGHEKELLDGNEAELITLTKNNRLTVGQHRYHKLKLKFENSGWKIKDYLAYYNNLDVVPFLTALDNLSAYYEERGVDVFKDAISGKYRIMVELYII